MSKIVITGGAGFIGSQLGYKLHNDGHEVVLIDNMSFGYEDNLTIEGKTFGTFLLCDVRSEEVFKHVEGADIVYHFAGISCLPVCQSDPYYAIDVNVAGTANMLEASRRAGVSRFIFASTSATYENSTEFPTPEDCDAQPDLIYSMSKQQAEMLCNSYYKNYGLETVILRYFNVYGPHQDYRRKSPPFIGYVLKELLEGTSPTLHSDGEQKRDYVYVDDVNNLNEICAYHPAAPGNAFNVASGLTYSVNEIFDIIAKNMKSSVRPSFTDSKNFWNKYERLFSSKYTLNLDRVRKEVTKFTLGSNTKARDLLGWEPCTNIEDGLREVVNYATQSIPEDS